MNGIYEELREIIRAIIVRIACISAKVCRGRVDVRTAIINDLYYSGRDMMPMAVGELSYVQCNFCLLVGVSGSCRWFSIFTSCIAIAGAVVCSSKYCL